MKMGSSFSETRKPGAEGGPVLGPRFLADGGQLWQEGSRKLSCDHQSWFMSRVPTVLFSSLKEPLWENQEVGVGKLTLAGAGGGVSPSCSGPFPQSMNLMTLLPRGATVIGPSICGKHLQGLETSRKNLVHLVAPAPAVGRHSPIPRGGG